MIISGIDPGLKGGIAFYDTITSKLTTYKMPLNNDGVDGHCLVMLLNAWKPERLVLEDQFVVPDAPGKKRGKMGKQSILVMGQNWGIILGVAQALRIKTVVVLPNVWQAKLCPRKLFQFDDTKDRAHAAARKFFPGHNFVPDGCANFHDGMVDAACLAKYAELYFQLA